MRDKKKIAVLLFNFGGPSSLKDVQRFLFSLFNDKYIISLRQPFRFFLACYISYFRSKKTKKLYSLIGGKSPILKETLLQASELSKKLDIENNVSTTYKVFVAMQYSYPYLDDTIKDINLFSPNEVILLPLYPQYSSTTTLSFLANNVQKVQCITDKVNVICCYHTHELYIKSISNNIYIYYKKALKFGIPRILFSAHGIPKYMVENGDPYELHVNETAKAIVKKLQITDLDWKVCYQSKVGRLEWLLPSTKNEIEIASKNDIPIVIVPISFVSENLETLVELDIEYKEYAKYYFRVPVVGIDNDFISALADIVKKKKCSIECSIENKLCWKQYIKTNKN